MAKIEFDLEHGLKVGDDVLKHVVLGEPSVADLLECCEESERAVMTPEGPTMLASPTLMGALTLCRQIKRIGNIEGPLDLAMLKKLHPDDWLLLQAEAAKLDVAAKAALEALTDRGRSKGVGAGD